MTAEEPEGFLSRWSRRKRAEAEAVPVPVPEPGPSPTLGPAEAPGELAAEQGSERGASAPPAAPGCPIPGVPQIDLASLPPVEELTAESDFGLFLRPGVPTLLRNAALRRMWSLDPAIRDYIGPVEYQWDFNAPGGLPFGFSNELVGDIGKLLAQAIGGIEDLAEDLAEEAPDAAAPTVCGATTPESPPPDLAAPDPALPEPAPDALVAEAPPAAEPAAAPQRRHGGALPG